MNIWYENQDKEKPKTPKERRKRKERRSKKYQNKAYS